MDKQVRRLSFFRHERHPGHLLRLAGGDQVTALRVAGYTLQVADVAPRGAVGRDLDLKVCTTTLDGSATSTTLSAKSPTS